MSFLRLKSNAATTPVYTGMQVQTSSSALPIPILWGTNQLAPNAIWCGNFRAVRQTASGKGGGAVTTGYDYRAALILGLCEGPIAGVGAIWNGQAACTAASLGLSLFAGETPQAAWSYVAAASASEALGYNGTAYVCCADFDMGAGASIGSLTVEAQGRLLETAAVNGLDADPAMIIFDFLTNPQYGVGFPAAGLDAASLFGASGDASYQTYCRAVGFALSPALIDREPANSILSRWLQLTNSTALWSAGRLKIIPFADGPATGALASGAAVSYVPELSPAYDLDDRDFLREDGADPLQVSRSDPYSAYNMQALEIAQRSNYYDATPITAFDQNAIDRFGLRIASTIVAHEICEPNVAQLSAQSMLQRGLYIRNAYTFRLSWEYCLLEPMDLVALSDAGLGLSRATARIIDIEEDEAGLLTVTAEEFPYGVGSAAIYPVQSGASSSIDRNAAPASVEAPIIFEPPAALTGGAGEIWIAACGGAHGVADPLWGGADIWLSTDGASYAQIGAITGPARQGVAFASLPAGAAAIGAASPDMSETLAVDLSASGGTLASASASDAAAGASLCLLDNELLAFEQATLTGPGVYALSGLWRGFYGSTPAAHAAGARFVRLDAAIFKYALPAAYVGRTLWVKLQSFNIFGRAAQDLATCVAWAFTPSGASLTGPVARALSIGTGLDYALATGAVDVADEYGLASDAYASTVDLGLASA